MNRFRQLFIGLLILISISFIYVSPGMGTFDTFNSIVYNKFASLDLYNLFINLFRFPLGTQTFFVTILYFFPLNNLLALFTIQTAWYTHKFVIWGFYILTWISILIFTKHTKNKGVST